MKYKICNFIQITAPAYTSLFLSGLAAWLLFGCFSSFIIPVSIGNLLVSLNFSLFGFGITASSIIVGFVNRNPVIKNAMKKGHYLKVVISEVIAFLSSVMALIAFFFSNNKLVVVFSIPAIISTGWLFYFVLVSGIYIVLRDQNKDSN